MLIFEENIDEGEKQHDELYQSNKVDQNAG